jgi:hypothetical protein
VRCSQPTLSDVGNVPKRERNQTNKAALSAINSRFINVACHLFPRFPFASRVFAKPVVPFCLHCTRQMACNLGSKTRLCFTIEEIWWTVPFSWKLLPFFHKAAFGRPCVLVTSQIKWFAAKERLSLPISHLLFAATLPLSLFFLHDTQSIHLSGCARLRIRLASRLDAAWKVVNEGSSFSTDTRTLISNQATPTHRPHAGRVKSPRLKHYDTIRNLFSERLEALPSAL